MDGYRTGGSPGHTTTREGERGSMSPRSWPRWSDASATLATQHVLCCLWCWPWSFGSAHPCAVTRYHPAGKSDDAGPAQRPFGRL